MSKSKTKPSIDKHSQVMMKALLPEAEISPFSALVLLIALLCVTVANAVPVLGWIGFAYVVLVLPQILAVLPKLLNRDTQGMRIWCWSTAVTIERFYNFVHLKSFTWRFPNHLILLAYERFQQGKFAQAERLFRAAISAIQMRPNCWRVSVEYAWVGTCLRAHKRYAEAEAYLKEVLQKPTFCSKMEQDLQISLDPLVHAEFISGFTKAEVLRRSLIVEQLALALVEQQKQSEAEELLRKELSDLQSRGGLHPWDRYVVLGSLLELLNQQGHHDKVVQLASGSIWRPESSGDDPVKAHERQFNARTFGLTYPHITCKVASAAAQGLMSVSLIVRGGYTNADEELARTCVELVRKSALTEDPADQLSVLANVLDAAASVCWQREKLTDALEFRKRQVEIAEKLPDEIKGEFLQRARTGLETVKYKLNWAEMAKR